MAARRLLFGKYNYTSSIQELARLGWTKEQVRKAFESLGYGDVAENTIKTQFTDYKNPRYAKEDVPFTPDELSQLEKARNGETTEPDNEGGDDFDELLVVKEFASGVGGVQRLKRLCEVILRLQ